MKIEKSKKSATEIIMMVALLALSLLFLLVYSGVFTKLFGKGTSDLREQFSAAGDADNDGVINVADNCPCPGQGFGIIENDGCPAGYKINNDGKGKEDRACLATKT